MRHIALLLACFVFLIPQTAWAINVGVGSYINSLDTSAMQTSADLLAESSSNWTRLTVEYDPNQNFNQLDAAVDKINEKGIKILLLFSHAAGLTASQFESFVDTVVTRYKDKIDGYEIFNEIDNTMSASAYKPFLEAAYNKIKAIDGSATVVASGLTGRKEAIDYWNALYGAGGGCCFNALGIHPYRTSEPETKEFNNGSMVDSLNQAVSAINAHGGGKKIWVTEFGWQSGAVGEAVQGHYLARGFLLAATVAEVDHIISYKLFDEGGGQTFGIATSGFAKKGSFSSLAGAVSRLKGLSFSERVDAFEKKTIDNFDASVSGWKDDGSSDGSVSLSAASGRSGGGLKYSWTFSSGTGYVIAKKQVALSGEPSGLAVWINGDNQSSVWKLRIVDAGNETFQFDLGQAPSGWNQFSFDFAGDKAKTSWSGDGVINYPIKFDSIVLDNQNGSTSGSVTIDDLEARYGSTDLYALRFGGTLAYWKASGSAAAAVCGKDLTFTTYPQYTSVTASACGSSAAAQESSSGGSPSSTKKKAASSAPAPAAPAPIESVVIPTAEAETAGLASPKRFALSRAVKIAIAVGAAAAGGGLVVTWRLGALTLLRRLLGRDVM